MYIYEGPFAFQDPKNEYITFMSNSHMDKFDVIRTSDGYVAVVTDCEENIYKRGEYKITIRPMKSCPPSWIKRAWFKIKLLFKKLFA